MALVAPEEPENGLDEQTLLSLLGNERRYACLHYLLSVDEEVISVREMATELADELTDEPPASENFENSVYISLCQTHLPKLEAAGLIEYDENAKSVSPGPSFPTLERYVESNETPDVRIPTMAGTGLSGVLVSLLFVVPDMLEGYVAGAALAVLLIMLGYVAWTYR